MKNLFILSLFCVGALIVTPAHAYKDLPKDYAICTQGGGKVANSQVVQACTRLIDNSVKKNSLTGYFYALRALASNDKARNCRDARQAIRLLDKPNLIQHAKAIEKANC